MLIHFRKSWGCHHNLYMIVLLFVNLVVNQDKITIRRFDFYMNFLVFVKFPLFINMLVKKEPFTYELFS